MMGKLFRNGSNKLSKLITLCDYNEIGDIPMSCSFNDVTGQFRLKVAQKKAKKLKTKMAMQFNYNLVQVACMGRPWALGENNVATMN